MKNTKRWLRGLWAYYLAYTNTAVHAATAAAFAIFGLLVFLDPLFAFLAIASYVVPPIVLYMREGGVPGRRADGLEGTDGIDSVSVSESGANTASASTGHRRVPGDGQRDSGRGGRAADVDHVTDSGRDDTDFDSGGGGSDGDTDSDSDSDSDSDGSDRDSDSDGDTDSDSDDGDTDTDSDSDSDT
ncbi:hypothetical protein OB955_03195 [Halobacteria archaeon AArc-m2/3/4]|uniref:Uncharacterized protein n=1 Tax=Natronoglomus mannanivorans TaxID=2979990 RepID=A0ABT2Q9Z4_9EURY|nr:hypothetical protein [Halobacteria archaeon AArc-m2/3/4]